MSSMRQNGISMIFVERRPINVPEPSIQEQPLPTPTGYQPGVFANIPSRGARAPPSKSDTSVVKRNLAILTPCGQGSWSVVVASWQNSAPGITRWTTSCDFGCSFGCNCGCSPDFKTPLHKCRASCSSDDSSFEEFL